MIDFDLGEKAHVRRQDSQIRGLPSIGNGIGDDKMMVVL